ncbi:hypothetical protein [Sulfurimonas diazotrophicus]|uniref:DNA-directed DNA polymerase family A palm domain-containing protein n=1 Tax=Sulfurimonas diazotrophicus TaxID=3131939 RepID=A0ABZ3H9Q3_9BACT
MRNPTEGRVPETNDEDYKIGKKYLSELPLTFEELFEEGENPYDKKRFFKLLLWAESDEIEMLVEDLLDEYQADYKPIRYHSTLPLYRDILKVILCNALAYKGMDIIVSLRSPTYSIDKRYNPSHMSYRITLNLLEFLDHQGYINLYRGDRGSTGTQRRSMFNANSSLLNMLDTYGVKYNMLTTHSASETVELKKADKLTGYFDEDITLWRREMLNRYNVLLNVSRRHIAILGESSREPILMRCRFHDNFGRGGRVYGGLWQNTKKADRKTITLYDQETVEVDIQNCSLSMAMHLEGFEIEGDLYAIRDYPRELVKIAVQVMFNLTAASDKDGINKAANSLVKETGEDKEYLKQMVRDIHVHYQCISSWFFTGQGLRLQFYDSQVCFRVIEEFVKAERVVLTIHDSFIVAREDQGLLMEVMLESYRYYLGKEPVLRVEEGYLL